MKTKKIILIRHAESESNAGGIFEHNRLVKLTEKGKQQAQGLVEILEKDFPRPDRIIVSKFLRTQETAEPLENRISNNNFYNELMKKSDDLYKNGEIVQLKNTEVLDITDLVEKYIRN